MKLLYWIIVAPIMLIAVLFAISNRQTVLLGLWPLPYEISVPVYLIAMLPLAAGFIAGGMVAWLGAGKARARARAGARQVGAQEREIATLQGRVAELERRPAGPDESPARPGRDIVAAGDR